MRTVNNECTMSVPSDSTLFKVEERLNENNYIWVIVGTSIYNPEVKFDFDIYYSPREAKSRLMELNNM